MSITKIAIITGGASGMGLAVAKALTAQEQAWHVHLLDVDQDRGRQAVDDLHPKATFHQANVSVYHELAAAFHAVFEQHRRLDFVFANAGVIERTNFYTHALDLGLDLDQDQHEHEDDMPDLRTLEVDLHGVVYTSSLAGRYFRRSPHQGHDSALVMTASCGGLYPSFYSPLYTAAKHGVVGFMRAIAPSYWSHGIRVNAICPGIVQTNLVDPKGWATFPSQLFIASETIAATVLMLIHPDTHTSRGIIASADSDAGAGIGIQDANGTFIPASKAFGRAVEISGDRVYFREQPEFCDLDMRRVMQATDVENQVGGILE